MPPTLFFLPSSFFLHPFSLIQSFLFLDSVLHTFDLFPSLCSLPFPGIFSHLPTSLVFTKHSPCTVLSALSLLCLMLAPHLFLSFSSGPEFMWANVISVTFHLMLPSFPAGLPKPARLPITLTASGVLLASVNPSPFPPGAAVSTCPLGTWLPFRFLSADVSPHSRGSHQPMLPTSQ